MTCEPRSEAIRVDINALEELHPARHPAEALTGCRVIERSDGRARAIMPVPEFRSETATLGWMGTVADAAAAQAFATRVADGHGIRTMNLRLDRLGPLPPPQSMTTAEGFASGVDELTGLSRATLLDVEGRAFAECTARFAVVPSQEATMPPQPHRPAIVHPTTPSELVGVQRVQFDSSRVDIIARPPLDVCNHFGIVHGGLHAGFVDFAMRKLLTTMSPSLYRMLDLSLVYHRPAMLEHDRGLRLTASIDRRGRRITTVDASILSSSGTPLTIARGTFRT